MDKDEFQAWKDSPATQWVLNHLRQKSESTEERLRAVLYHSTGLPPQEWASLQARAGHDRGLVVAFNYVLDLEYEHTQEEADESERNTAE